MNSLWDANLKVLRQRTDSAARHLARALTEAGPGADLGLRGRDGAGLPGLVDQGRARSLVSTFDAAKEASRWAEGVTGTVAVFGAAGTAAARALFDGGALLMFWVEPRLELWRSLFTWEDWTPWLEREWVPVLDADGLEAELKHRYHPLWDGGFRTLEWRAATSGREGDWDGHRAAARRALDAVASDTSTQARFGERWYRNTLANLQRLVPGEVDACTGARVVIAGAGPGLEDALEDGGNQRWLTAREATGDKLFATDTALPALSARGIVPDLILCLDGQLATYHHFVPQRPHGVSLVADLASLPLLGRLGLPGVRYLSGHPFGTVIRRVFPELPFLDGSLGNVSGLALKAAQALGAATVDAWGVDFAYRDGKSYARGTYVYNLAERRAGRLRPSETLLGASCYGASGLERTWDEEGRALDTTPRLREYRRLWQASTPAAPTRLAHNGAGERWAEFADHWHSRLVALPMTSGPLHAFVSSLPPLEREDWLALWPLALALHRTGVATRDLPEFVRDRALSILE